MPEEKKFQYTYYFYDLASTLHGSLTLWKIKAYFWRKRVKGEFVVKEKGIINHKIRI